MIPLFCCTNFMGSGQPQIFQLFFQRASFEYDPKLCIKFQSKKIMFDTLISLYNFHGVRSTTNFQTIFPTCKFWVRSEAVYEISKQKNNVWYPYFAEQISWGPVNPKFSNYFSNVQVLSTIRSLVWNFKAKKNLYPYFKLQVTLFLLLVLLDLFVRLVRYCYYNSSYY